MDPVSPKSPTEQTEEEYRLEKELLKEQFKVMQSLATIQNSISSSSTELDPTDSKNISFQLVEIQNSVMLNKKFGESFKQTVKDLIHWILTTLKTIHWTKEYLLKESLSPSPSQTGPAESRSPPLSAPQPSPEPVPAPPPSPALTPPASPTPPPLSIDPDSSAPPNPRIEPATPPPPSPLPPSPETVPAPPSPSLRALDSNTEPPLLVDASSSPPPNLLVEEGEREESSEASQPSVPPVEETENDRSSSSISSTSSSSFSKSISAEKLLSELKGKARVSPSSYAWFMETIKKSTFSDVDTFRVVSKLNKKAFSSEYFELRVKSKSLNRQFMREVAQIQDPELSALYTKLQGESLLALIGNKFNNIPYEIEGFDLFFKDRESPPHITLFKEILTNSSANADHFIALYQRIKLIQSPECQKILMDRLLENFYRAPFNTLSKENLTADAKKFTKLPKLQYMEQKYLDEARLRR